MAFAEFFNLDNNPPTASVSSAAVSWGPALPSCAVRTPPAPPAGSRSGDGRRSRRRVDRDQLAASDPAAHLVRRYPIAPGNVRDGQAGGGIAVGGQEGFSHCPPPSAALRAVRGLGPLYVRSRKLAKVCGALPALRDTNQSGERFRLAVGVEQTVRWI